MASAGRMGVGASDKAARAIRAAAQAEGLLQYFTGRPCRNGHVTPRLVSCHKCMECNRLRAHEHRERWDEARRAAHAAACRVRHAENRDAELAKRKARWATDAGYRERATAASRRNHQRRYRDPNYAERIREQCRLYAKANRGVMNARIARRRAAVEQRTPAWTDLDAIQAFYAACPPGHHVDHIIPLRGRTVSGLHVLNNLQYLPAAENLSKANRS